MQQSRPGKKINGFVEVETAVYEMIRIPAFPPFSPISFVPMPRLDLPSCSGLSRQASALLHPP